MEQLLGYIKDINNYLWNYFLLFLLCGTGVYFTLRLRFVQIRKFGVGIRLLFGKKEKNGGKGEMSSFQALTTAIAAQVGTGNLAGAATAIAAGGPGAIFWMWISAFFGMATIFAEATCAQKYRVMDKAGQVTGGPVYYIKAAFQGKAGKALAAIFSVLLILALGFFGNMVQSNSIGAAFHNAFGIDPLWVGVIIAVLVLVVVLGGISRIASVTEKLVPIMAIFYIVGALCIIALRLPETGRAFVQIVTCAFSPTAALGGAMGITVQKAMRYGVARGLFSNEAGMGSTPHAHAIAKVRHPCEQGYIAMIGVFVDTFIILTLTALVILTTGGFGSSLDGIELTQNAFSSVMHGFGPIFIAICLCFFAFSTIIGWYFFGEVNVRYLFGQKAVKVYALLVAGFVILGSALKVSLVWELADTFNGLMVIPNLLALLVLGGIVAKLLKEYEKKR